MKKLILFIFCSLFFLPINAYAFGGDIIKTDKTLDFNFIVTDVYEDEEGIVFIEGIKIIINNTYIGVSNSEGIAIIKNVPIKNGVLSIYDKNSNLLYEKDIEYGYGLESRGFRYNSISVEDINAIHLNLGYDINDITSGNIRMDINVNFEEGLASTSLITRMLGGGDNSGYIIVVFAFGAALALFIYVYEEFIEKE